MYERRIQKFRIMDAQKFPDPDVNLFVGSSSIRRWNTLHEDMLPKKSLNRGFGGSDMKSLWLLFDELVAPYKFSKLFVYEGDNDLNGKKGQPEKVLEYFTLIEEKAHAHCPEAQIVFISIKCSPKRKSAWGRYRAANELFKSYCESKPYLHFVDVATYMFNDAGETDDKLFNSKDRIHPSKQGYELLTSLIKPHLYPEDQLNME